MKQEFISVNDLQIAYNNKNPELANTIFFIHGNSGSANVWRKQVESSLLNDYRLITIDLLNHGGSDPIDTEGDFSLPAIAKIMSAPSAKPPSAKRIRMMFMSYSAGFHRCSSLLPHP